MAVLEVGTDAPQPMKALARAERIRRERAAIKKAVRAGEVKVADLILSTPESLGTMTVYDLLMCQHRWGRLRCRRILVRGKIDEWTLLGDLDREARGRLVSGLLTG